jgi:hypothetical protein
MNEDINSLIDELDDGDMVRVERLITKLASKQRNKKNQPKKVQPTPSDDEFDLDENDSDPKMVERTATRGIRRKKKSQTPQRGGRRHKGKAGRPEQIEIGNRQENKFLTTTDPVIANARSKNTDKKTDRLLAGDNQVTPRNGTPNLIEIECAGDCGYVYEVSPAMIFNDPEKGPTFVCNDCSSSRRH